MIDLYYWPTPNGWKISIMLEECGLEYRMIPVNIGEGAQFEPDFLKISPNNRMPAIVDHDGPGGDYHLMESGAILIFLAEKTGRFLPADPRRYRAIEWLMWQMGGVGPMFGQNGHFKLYATEDIPYAKKRYLDESNRLYGVLDRRLAEAEYPGGDEYTIADMALMPWFMLHRMQGIVMDDYPNVRRWYDTVKQRPAVRRGVDLGRDLRRKPEEMGEEQKRNLFGDKQFGNRA
ncbi:MAG: glutathione binding-like protein [Minwuia sp.]|uniref:glutathione binding-like protein n=1 Tax=Minwuia sp. TaxID=2493630 RepID=UPI003A843A79